MRFVKPLDGALIRELAEAHDLLVTVEENAIAGGAGSAVAEWLSAEGIEIPCVHLGLPDRYIDHAEHAQQLAACGLDAAGILASVHAAYGARFPDRTLPDVSGSAYPDRTPAR
jgi:1-deoxy-D-xylulose-5-phosphate synthase